MDCTGRKLERGIAGKLLDSGLVSLIKWYDMPPAQTCAQIHSGSSSSAIRLLTSFLLTMAYRTWGASE